MVSARPIAPIRFAVSCGEMWTTMEIRHRPVRNWRTPVFKELRMMFLMFCGNDKRKVNSVAVAIFWGVVVGLAAIGGMV